MPIPFIVIAIIALVATVIIGELLRPRPQDNSKAANLGDFSFPTAEESRAIPVVWGTVQIAGPNVVWYGDLKTQKLQKRVKSGLFSHDEVTLGYRYAVGMHFALCHGPVDSIREVWSDERVAWSGNVTSGSFIVDSPRHYGGDSEEDAERSGEGGLYARCYFYPGNEVQTPDVYLTGILTKIPAHRGVCHVVWAGPRDGLKKGYVSGPVRAGSQTYLGGYIGVSPNLKPFAFVVRRIPNYLNATYCNINDGDANPADILYEVLTNERWGLGLTSSYIDISSFLYVQQRLHSEGLGYSAEWANAQAISQTLEEILNFIDGVIYTDLVTGLITLKIARNDYDVSTLPVFDDTNVVEISTFSRSAWDDTTNEVVVLYIDRTKKYKEKPSIAQDLANVRIQGGIVSTKISYGGAANPTTAGKLAFRDLRQLSIPLARVTMKVNRDAISLRPASVLKLTWPEYGLEEVLMRVIRIRYGDFKNATIEIDAVQDVFSIAAGLYGEPGPGWTNPNGTATTITLFKAFEAPFFRAGGYMERLHVVAAEPASSQFAFNTYISTDGGSTYVPADTGDSFTPTGTLLNPYPQLTAARDATTNDFIITPSSPDNMIFLVPVGQTEILNEGSNLFYLENPNGEFEMMAFESVTNLGNGTYRLNNLWRGLLDTTPSAHLAGARAWFFSYGEAQSSDTYTLGSSALVKVESIASETISALSAQQGIAFNRRPYRPYPPGHFRINGSTTTLTVPDGENDIALAWEARNKTVQTTVIQQNATGITAEPLTTYNIKIYNDANSLVRTVTGLTATSYTYLIADQKNDNILVGVPTNPLVLTFQLYSEKDGLQSFQAQHRTVVRTGGTAPASYPTYTPPTGTSYVPPPDGGVVGGFPVPSTPPTGGQTIVFDPTTNTWIYTSFSGNATQLQGRPISATAPTSGQVLAWNGSTWIPTTVATSLNGDVTGAVGTNTVIRLQGRSVSATAPNTGEALVWNGSAWTPTAVTSNPTLAGDVTGTASSNTVVRLQGRNLSSAAPGTGQAIIWNGSVWIPTTITTNPTLGGDVTGLGSANTVTKIRNRTVRNELTIPDGYVLTWNDTTSQWEAAAASGGSGGGGGAGIKTIFSSALDAHTANSTWEDIDSMTLNIDVTGEDLASLACDFTAQVAGTSAHNEHISFRFVLNGATFSEVWTKRKDEFPQNDERLLISIHSVISDLAAGTHTVKVQWQDNGTSLDTNIYERRLTTIGGGESVATTPGTSPIVLTTATFSTGTINHLQEQTGTIGIGKSFFLMRVDASHECRIRLYSKDAYRVTDAARSLGVLPTGEHGLLFEAVPISSNLSLDLSPMVPGANLETIRSENIPIAVQNRSGSPADVQVTFTYLLLEDALAMIGTGSGAFNITTASLADNAVETGTVSVSKTGLLIRLTVNDDCRIRLYQTAAARTADAARLFTDRDIFLSGEAHGIITDLVLNSTVGLDWKLAPPAILANVDDTRTSNIYYSIQNLSGSTQTFTIDGIVNFTEQ